jgi:hypothetical protein
LLMDVQPNIDGFSDVVHQMRHIRFFIKQGRSTAATTLELWAKASQNRLLWNSWSHGLQNLLDSCFNNRINPCIESVFHLFQSPQCLYLLFRSTPRAAPISGRFFLQCYAPRNNTVGIS